MKTNKKGVGVIKERNLFPVSIQVGFYPSFYFEAGFGVGEGVTLAGFYISEKK